MSRPLRVGACLSLTGRYASFGTQAARGLSSWAGLDGHAELQVIDDASSRDRVETVLPDLAASSDVVLGPYSSELVRRAARVVRGWNRVLWNHGGSGDDVEQAAPGRMVSVLAPTSRYAEPFVRMLAGRSSGTLLLRAGKGRFAAQVIAGAATCATGSGLATVCIEELPGPDTPWGRGEQPWHLFSAGSYPDDIRLVNSALGLTNSPTTIGAVAAGVRDFARDVGRPDGVYGIAQWRPGLGGAVELGPTEEAFLRAYARAGGGMPDYPAVQAAATAAVAAHCARTTATVGREATWAAASALTTSTLLGRFAIDPDTGSQLAHRTVLTRWVGGVLSTEQ